MVFSSTIIAKSGGVSLARDLAHTRPHRDIQKTPRSAFIEFRKRLERNVAALTRHEPTSILLPSCLNGADGDESRATVRSTSIHAASAANTGLPTASVDLIVTSPPYANNAIDYMRAHKFSLVWFGWKIADLTRIRAQYVGHDATAGLRCAGLPNQCEETLAKLAERDDRKALVLRPLLRGDARRNPGDAAGLERRPVGGDRHRLVAVAGSRCRDTQGTRRHRRKCRPHPRRNWRPPPGSGQAYAANTMGAATTVTDRSAYPQRIRGWIGEAVMPGRIESLRRAYHHQIAREVLRQNATGIPNNADRGSASSVRIARGIVKRIGLKIGSERLAGQTAGRRFEAATRNFLHDAFGLLAHLRPGEWVFSLGGDIRDYEQYSHLSQLRQVVEQHEELRIIFGDYIVTPDIVVCREPVTDAKINEHEALLNDDTVATYTPLRHANSRTSILHASVSCKWTIRSDRSQNARTEGLNLVRNRKGKNATYRCGHRGTSARAHCIAGLWHR